MVRKLIAGMALSLALSATTPTGAMAQPPSPPEIMHRVDRGVRHVVSDVDHKVRHTRRRSYVVHHHVTPIARHRVRALCNDRRFHTGRTGFGACASHGGLR